LGEGAVFCNPSDLDTESDVEQKLLWHILASASPRGLGESAKLLFDDGDHAGARTRFKRAYDVSKDVALLWNIGVCEKALNHCAGSARVVSRYLKEGGQR
jgi:hypothetical protein